jgi:hypothetical protein
MLLKDSYFFPRPGYFSVMGFKITVRIYVYGSISDVPENWQCILKVGLSESCSDIYSQTIVIPLNLIIMTLNKFCIESAAKVFIGPQGLS